MELVVDGNFSTDNEKLVKSRFLFQLIVRDLWTSPRISHLCFHVVIMTSSILISVSRAKSESSSQKASEASKK